MTEEIKTEGEGKELTEEEKAQKILEWEAYVRNEINTLLDMFLPMTKSGIVGLKYINPEKEKYEGQTIYDEDKAIGVDIAIRFDFEKEFDIPKESESE
jgi:hypothetical protein